MARPRVYNYQWTTVYRRFLIKRMCPAHFYIILAALFSFFTYQIYSHTFVSSVENKSLPKEYYSRSIARKSRSRSTSSVPLVPETQPKITPSNEPFNRVTKSAYILTKDVQNVNVASKVNSVRDLNDVSDFDVISDIRVTRDANIVRHVNAVTGVKVASDDISLTRNVKDVSDVKVVRDFDVARDVNLVRNLKISSDVTTEPYEMTTKIDLSCDEPPGLGPISVNTSDISMDDVEMKFPELELGGQYSPPDCIAHDSVAIIVPYRDRKNNLAIFLNHMHPFLMKQRLRYGIFIVEQKGIYEFNRGKLLNIGFMEAGNWKCFIFHDIDLLPVDLRNIYSCPDEHNARLYDALAAFNRSDTLRGTSPGNFGGVSALTEEQFTRINGYSNGYWGWGGEDNDLYFRLTTLGYKVKQYNSTIARYIALKHKQKSRNPRRYRLLLQTMKSFNMDGLSSLKYQLVSTTRHRLYTHILVSIDHNYHELQELLQEHDNFRQMRKQYVIPKVPRNLPSPGKSIRKRPLETVSRSWNGPGFSNGKPRL